MRRALGPAAGVCASLIAERRFSARGELPHCWPPSTVRCETSGLGRATQTRPTTSRTNRPTHGPQAPTWKEFLKFDTYVFDCDGVIWGIPPEESKQSVATINHLLRLGKRVMFVTNNSNKSRASFLKDLEKRGVNFGGISDEEKLHWMISASYTTAVFLKHQGLCRPFVITSDTGLLDEFRLLGINDYFATVNDDGTTSPSFESINMEGAGEIVASHPSIDCVVVGWDHSLTALKVATAINYLKWHQECFTRKLGYRTMPLIACSGDSGGVLGTTEFEGSTLKLRAIGNGAMADVIARSFDPPKEWIDMGKPSDALLWLLRAPGAYDVTTSRAIMIGDTLQTDIVFGNRGGMATLLVLSGVTQADELEAAVLAGNPMRWPTYVLPKLGTFLEEGQIEE